MALLLRPHRILLLSAIVLVFVFAATACGTDDEEVDSSSGQTGAQPIVTIEIAATPTLPAAVDVATAAPTDMPDPTSTQEPAIESTSPEIEPANPAPEFGSIDSWHNSEPVTLAELRGTPILLVFWADF